MNAHREAIGLIQRKLLDILRHSWLLNFQELSADRVATCLIRPLSYPHLRNVANSNIGHVDICCSNTKSADITSRNGCRAVNDCWSGCTTIKE